MKTIRYTLTVLVTLGALGTLQVMADPAEKPPRKDPGERFAAQDTDGSGGISLAEFTANHEKQKAERKLRMGDKWDEARAAKAMPVEQKFAKIDKDGDASISPKEMRSWDKHRREQMKERQEARGNKSDKGKGNKDGKGEGDKDGKCKGDKGKQTEPTVKTDKPE